LSLAGFNQFVRVVFDRKIAVSRFVFSQDADFVVETNASPVEPTLAEANATGVAVLLAAINSSSNSLRVARADNYTRAALVLGVSRRIAAEQWT
jgi:hypothetical protein